MNLRQFSMTLLVSALPLYAVAESAGISFHKEDFISAERLSQDGETLIDVKLSKSGKAKVKKLNRNSVGQEVRTEVAGVSSNFKLREPIQGDGMQMGPFVDSDAQKVVREINNE